MRFQVYKDSRGEWRWPLLAKNGSTGAELSVGWFRKKAGAKMTGKRKNADLED